MILRGGHIAVVAQVLEALHMVAEQSTVASVEQLQQVFSDAVSSVGQTVIQVLQRQQLRWRQQQ